MQQIHWLFVRQYNDNVELFSLINAVFDIVKSRLSGDVKKTVDEAVRSGTGAAATGAAATEETKPESSTGAATGAEIDAATGADIDADKPESEPLKNRWAPVWKILLKEHDYNGDKKISYGER